LIQNLNQNIHETDKKHSVFELFYIYLRYIVIERIFGYVQAPLFQEGGYMELTLVKIVAAHDSAWLL
jgi:hypothetical protein